MDESEYRTEAAYRKSYSQAKRFFEAGVFKNENPEEFSREKELDKKINDVMPFANAVLNTEKES